MSKNWHNSSLKKIVPSENKGAKIYVRVAEEKKKKKKDYITKESHLGGQSLPRSHMLDNLGTNCNSIIPLPARSIWKEMPVCRRVPL